MLSPISITAITAVLVLVGVAGYRSYAVLNPEARVITADALAGDQRSAPGADWQQEMVLLGLATSTETPSSGDPLGMIGPVVVAQIVGAYAGLQEQGAFNAASAQAVGENLASNLRAVVPHRTYTLADIPTDADTSYKRMLQYRTDMQDALKPLLENTRAEFELYGAYVESNDAALLDELKQYAVRYKQAAGRASGVVVPHDAASQHIDILNALESFAATIEKMAVHADDPFASAALLAKYNESETAMYSSFDRIAAYYRTKTP